MQIKMCFTQDPKGLWYLIPARMRDQFCTPMFAEVFEDTFRAYQVEGPLAYEFNNPQEVP